MRHVTAFPRRRRWPPSIGVIARTFTLPSPLLDRLDELTAEQDSQPGTDPGYR